MPELMPESMPESIPEWMDRAVRVIVVNYNAGEALVDSVEAALASPLAVRVTVADNASRDGSLSSLNERLGAEPRLDIRRNDSNLGFASAVNRVAREAREAYLLVLNPDCVLGEGAMEALVEALEGDPGAALAGAWVTDSEGRVQKGTWRRLPNPWRSLMTASGLHRFSGRVPALAGIEMPGHPTPDGVVEAEAVSGACMLLRRAATAQVGYFDEQYAMHCEDLDLMRRLRADGYRCLLVPAARAVHLGGVSSASRPWWVHRQKHRGMHRYFSKFDAQEHVPPFRWLVYAGIWGHYLLTLPLVPFRRRKQAS